MDAYTDYPFDFLGDEPGKEAPVRPVKVLSWDGDKYCRILVEGMECSVKSGYLYTIPVRLQNAERLSKKELHNLPRREV